MVYYSRYLQTLTTISTEKNSTIIFPLPMELLGTYMEVRLYHRRRIDIEEKAKVVAAAWEVESIHFFAALANLHQDDFKNRMNCTRTI